MISDLECFTFRFVYIFYICMHMCKSVYECKTIIQNHKKKLKYVLNIINNYYQKFKTGLPKDHKFQWTQVLYWTSLLDDTSKIKKVNT